MDSVKLKTLDCKFYFEAIKAVWRLRVAAGGTAGHYFLFQGGTDGRTGAAARLVTAVQHAGELCLRDWD